MGIDKELRTLTADLSELLEDADWLIGKLGRLKYQRPREPYRKGEDFVEWFKRSTEIPVKWLAEIISTFPGRVREWRSQYEPNSQSFMVAAAAPACSHEVAIEWLECMVNHLGVYTEFGEQPFDEKSLVAAVIFEWRKEGGPLTTVSEMTKPLGKDWRSCLKTELAKVLAAVVSTGEDESEQRNVPAGSLEKKRLLPRRAELAYQSFETAQIALEKDAVGKTITDRDAHNWLREFGPADYTVPEFDTWVRYVREGRKHYCAQKNSPRGGRGARSAISADKLDRRTRDRE